jgi:predicted transcriptional regulator
VINLIRTNKLKGIIVEKGLSQSDVAKSIGITPKTFYDKMKRGVFGTDEVEKMIQLLDIKNPADIFFAD